MLADMPPNSASNARGRLSAPSTAAPSMIVKSGAPLTNARVSSATGMLTNSAIAMMNTARTAQPIGVRFIAISVPRPRPLGQQLSTHQVVRLDRRVEQRVQDDQRAADRDHAPRVLLGQHEQREVELGTGRLIGAVV